jgi:hypothetical protein
MSFLESITPMLCVLSSTVVLIICFNMIFIILTASVYDFFETVPEQLQKYTSFLKLSFPPVGNPSEEKKDFGQAGITEKGILFDEISPHPFRRGGPKGGIQGNLHLWKRGRLQTLYNIIFYVCICISMTLIRELVIR